jgi:hypothetical protein
VVEEEEDRLISEIFKANERGGRMFVYASSFNTLRLCNSISAKNKIRRRVCYILLLTFNYIHVF